jgi:carbonic anhydrase
MGLTDSSSASTEPAVGWGSGTLMPKGGKREPSVTTFASRFVRAVGDPTDWLDDPAPLSSANPALSLAVVTCMDARLDLGTRLGIAIGDAHILRNAGGRVTPDVIRSLHLSVNLMNVREVGILHHTCCSLWGTDNDTLARRTGVDSIDFLPFQSVRDSLSADVATVLHEEILPAGGIVWGAVYSLASERISVVRGPVVAR